MGRGQGRGRGKGSEMSDCSPDNPLCVCGCVVCVAFVILGIVLFAVSWSSLEATEFGFEYNGISKELNGEKMFEGGRYFLGVKRSFVKFPKTQQTILFADQGEDADFGAMQARSKDGLQLKISASFQFTIVKDLAAVISLYGHFAEDYRSAYVRIARAVLRDAAAQYTAFKFFEERAAIIKTMNDALVLSMAKMNCTVQTFNLLFVQLPPRFQQEIQETEVAKQDIKTALNEYEEKLLVAEFTVKKASVQSEVLIRNAEAKAAGLLAQVATEVQSLNEKLEKESLSYQVLGNELGLSVEQLMSWIWTTSIEGQQGIIASVPQPGGVTPSRSNMTLKPVAKAQIITRTLANVTGCGNTTVANNKGACDVSFNITSCSVMSTAFLPCKMSSDGSASCMAETSLVLTAAASGCLGTSSVMCSCTGDEGSMTCSGGPTAGQAAVTAGTKMTCTGGVAKKPEKTCA